VGSRAAAGFLRQANFRFSRVLAIDITAAKKKAETAARLGTQTPRGPETREPRLARRRHRATIFNNLLTSILGNAGIIRLSLPPGGDIDAKLEAIETGATRAGPNSAADARLRGKGRLSSRPSTSSALAEGLVPLLEVSIARKAHLRLALDHQMPA